ncbi:hypothetical protein GGR56DRAFT_662190 [Xylariaceae sp. FL0804]|nr:hypothetical protein GGR56DRAFT_662190 [Xylariaceae sp. FL0804]
MVRAVVRRLVGDVYAAAAAVCLCWVCVWRGRGRGRVGEDVPVPAPLVSDCVFFFPFTSFAVFISVGIVFLCFSFFFLFCLHLLHLHLIDLYLLLGHFSVITIVVFVLLVHDPPLAPCDAVAEQVEQHSLRFLFFFCFVFFCARANLVVGPLFPRDAGPAAIEG